MGFLVDTNVISELRKGERCNNAVRLWFETVDESEIFISVLVIGEIVKGIGLIEKRDVKAAANLSNWLHELVSKYKDRILPITTEIAKEWGKISVPKSISVVDGLLAATSIVHNLTFVTRNTKDVAGTNAIIINPFL